MQYARNQYSQNGEDGIICEVIRRLDLPEPGTFVEFGTGNGRDLSNTLRLAECGWSGVWMEQNLDSFNTMKILAETFDGRVEALFGTVGFDAHDNLDVFLSRTKLPKYFDFLSVDIDSYDLQVWDNCHQYRPKLVLIEINSCVPLGVEQLNGSGKEGNSFTSMMKVAKRKNYTLVCHTGNLLFIDTLLAPKLGMPQSELDNPDSIFNPMWANWAKK